MPTYIYKCKKCETVFEKIHSMSERLTDCEYCDTIESLVKVPSSIATHYKNNETGKIVDDYIKEAKQEVEEEKNRMKEQEYKE